MMTDPAPASSIETAQVQLAEVFLYLENRPVAPELLALKLGVSEAEVVALMTDLDTRLRERASGLRIKLTERGYALRPLDDLRGALQASYQRSATIRLSRGALSTLAIIAWRQPITRADVNELRGVDASGAISTLVKTDLIRVVGRKEGLGRPSLYGTTERFLELFRLNSLDELPGLDELQRMMFAGGEETEDIAAEDAQPSLLDPAEDPKGSWSN